MMELFGSWAEYGAMLLKAAAKTAHELDVATGRAAARLASEIKKNIQSSGEHAGAPFRPLDPKTIARKGSSKPLIDTGALMGSLTSAKKENFVYFVGIPGDVMNERGIAIATYGRAHEFGFIGGGGVAIPARPWFRPTIEKFKTALMDDIKNEMNDFFQGGGGGRAPGPASRTPGSPHRKRDVKTGRFIK